MSAFGLPRMFVYFRLILFRADLLHRDQIHTATYPHKPTRDVLNVAVSLDVPGHRNLRTYGPTMRSTQWAQTLEKEPNSCGRPCNQHVLLPGTMPSEIADNVPSIPRNRPLLRVPARMIARTCHYHA